MTIEHYREYSLEVNAIAREEGRGTSSWSVTRSRRNCFQLTFTVLTGTPYRGHRVLDPLELQQASDEHGRRWTHGLIDTGRFDYGSAYSEVRGPGWHAEFGESVVTDDDVRGVLNQVLVKVEKAYFASMANQSLDPLGIVDVLGISESRLSRVLRQLEHEEVVSNPSGRPGLWRFAEGVALAVAELSVAQRSPAHELASHRARVEELLRLSRPSKRHLTMYCVKCRQKRDVKPGSVQEITMKSGKKAAKAVCSVCGTSMFKIGGKA